MRDRPWSTDQKSASVLQTRNLYHVCDADQKFSSHIWPLMIYRSGCQPMTLFRMQGIPLPVRKFQCTLLMGQTQCIYTDHGKDTVYVSQWNRSSGTNQAQLTSFF